MASPSRAVIVRSTDFSTASGTSSANTGNALSGSTTRRPRLSAIIPRYSAKLRSRNPGSNLRVCATLPCSSDAVSGAPSSRVQSIRSSAMPPAASAAISASGRGGAPGPDAASTAIGTSAAPAAATPAIASDTRNTPPTGA